MKVWLRAVRVAANKAGVGLAGFMSSGRVVNDVASGCSIVLGATPNSVVSSIMERGDLVLLGTCITAAPQPAEAAAKFATMSFDAVRSRTLGISESMHTLAI